MLRNSGIEEGNAARPLSHRQPAWLGRDGVVYRPKNTRLGRSVAIKVLRGGAAPTAVQSRFQREARAISSLNHPHICALYDVGTLADASYLVMEFVEGETLADILRNGPLPVDRQFRSGWILPMASRRRTLRASSTAI